MVLSRLDELQDILADVRINLFVSKGLSQISTMEKGTRRYTTMIDSLDNAGRLIEIAFSLIEKEKIWYTSCLNQTHASSPQDCSTTESAT